VTLRHHRPEVDLREAISDVRRGRVPATVYSDPELFELERRRLFGRAWMFLAHESEIPDPGDYVVRRIVEDSFIVCRDEEGSVRVLFNMCLHRGMQVCRSELGNASHFRCPYHAWTYKNTGELTGVPFHHDAYGGEAGLPREGVGLLPAPRVGVCEGLIFASLDAGAPDLEDYLGDFRFFLRVYLGQSEAGAELRGPQRFLVDANWKIAAENFSGDSYHTPHTHASVVDIDLFAAPKASKRKEGASYFAGRGGGTTYKLPDEGFRGNLAHVGYPEEMVDAMEAAWSAEHRALVGEAGFMCSAATVLPNLSFVHNWPRVGAEGRVTPFVSLRLWQPLGPTRIEVLSWFAVDRGAPEWFKEASYRAYLTCFGSSGMFEQDDVENWTSITAMARGQMAERLNLHGRMGLDRDGEPLTPPLASWPAPGRAFVGFGEHNQRQLLGLWCDYLEGGDGAREGGEAPGRVATLG